MNLLFISMSARVIFDNEGNIYLNSHMNRKTILRYSKLCDSFRIVLRDSGIRCSKEEASRKYDPFPYDLAEVQIEYNPFSPKVNIINLKKYIHLNRSLKASISWADKVIIASALGVYSNCAINICKKLEKDYLLLVGGFAFETDWHHGIEGKFLALKHEHDCKKNVKCAPYGIYVTDWVLQKRYPCSGKTIGCSDVEVIDTDEYILKKRLQRINNQQKIIIGTVAGIDIALKGQKDVIKALSLLKKEGYTEYRYKMLGNGEGKQLRDLAQKLDVLDMVEFVGAKPHSEIYKWLDNIDVYIQASYTEGLSRSVVEAMSRACPLICTRVGGNIELCSPKYLITPKSPELLRDALKVLSSKDEQIREAEKNFENAKKFKEDILDQKRNKFLMAFLFGNKMIT